MSRGPPTSVHGSITVAASEAGATRPPPSPAPDGSVVEGPVGTRGLARAKAAQPQRRLSEMGVRPQAYVPQAALRHEREHSTHPARDGSRPADVETEDFQTRRIYSRGGSIHRRNTNLQTLNHLYATCPHQQHATASERSPTGQARGEETRLGSGCAASP